MRTTSDTTAPVRRSESSVPLWLEALGHSPWSLFFPTCASHWLSGVRSSRPSREVKP
jgi:hypothetical protein